MATTTMHQNTGPLTDYFPDSVRQRGGRHAGQRGSGGNISDLERWISLGAGAGLAAVGLLHGKKIGWLATGLGAALLHRGYSGHCYGYQALGVDTSNESEQDHRGVPAKAGYRIEESLVIQETPENLFKFWRQLENLPRVMRHVKSVEVLDGRRSRWVAEGPLGSDVSWEAEIYNERENSLIAWRSLEGSQIDTAGSIHFEPLGHDRGTALRLSMKYNPPAGKLGAMISTLLGNDVESEVAEDLRNFKSMIEAGEIPTITGQPSGRA